VLRGIPCVAVRLLPLFCGLRSGCSHSRGTGPSGMAAAAPHGTGRRRPWAATACPNLGDTADACFESCEPAGGAGARTHQQCRQSQNQPKRCRLERVLDCRWSWPPKCWKSCGSSITARPKSSDDAGCAATTKGVTSIAASLHIWSARRRRPTQPVTFAGSAHRRREAPWLHILGF